VDYFDIPGSLKGEAFMQTPNTKSDEVDAFIASAEACPMKPRCRSCAYCLESRHRIEGSISGSRPCEQISLFVFLVCSQFPLYGIGSTETSDPFSWARFSLAANRGTLMDLGISLVITSGMATQLLAGTKLIEVDQSVKEERVTRS
jgi:hypothetical protein